MSTHDRLARVTPRQTYVVMVWDKTSDPESDAPDAYIGPFTLRQARAAQALIKYHAEIHSLSTDIPGWAVDRAI